MKVYVEYECKPPERPLYIADTIEEMAKHQNRHPYSIRQEVQQTKNCDYKKHIGTKVIAVEI